MLAFVIALGLLVASATVLPSVIGEMTFTAISLLTGGVLVYIIRNSSYREFLQGISSLALAAFVIGTANAFWIYGGLQAEFPEWSNFFGEFAIGIGYGFLFHALAHAFWNLNDNPSSVTLGFVMYVGVFAVVSLLFLTLFSGLTESFEIGIDFATASYIYFSGTLFVFGCINVILSSSYRVVSGFLALGFFFFFAADFVDLRFDFLPESLVSLLWNTGVVLMYATFVAAVHYYAFGAFPLLTIGSRRKLQVAN